MKNALLGLSIVGAVTLGVVLVLQSRGSDDAAPPAFGDTGRTLLEGKPRNKGDRARAFFADLLPAVGTSLGSAIR